MVHNTHNRWDFVHQALFQQLENINLGNWICSHPQVKLTRSQEPITTEVSHHLKTQTNPVSETL
jgi:hypothetical protein